MAKTRVKYSGVITVDLPPHLHAHVAGIARQAGQPIEVVLAVLLALQFPMPTQSPKICEQGKT